MDFNGSDSICLTVLLIYSVYYALFFVCLTRLTEIVPVVLFNGVLAGIFMQSKYVCTAIVKLTCFHRTLNLPLYFCHLHIEMRSP